MKYGCRKDKLFQLNKLKKFAMEMYKMTYGKKKLAPDKSRYTVIL